MKARLISMTGEQHDFVGSIMTMDVKPRIDACFIAIPENYKGYIVSSPVQDIQFGKVWTVKTRDREYKFEILEESK